MEACSSSRGRSRSCDEVRHSSRGRSSGIAIPNDMRDLDQQLPNSQCVLPACHLTLQTMMRTGHPMEHRSSTHGRSTCQWMMGRPPRMEGIRRLAHGRDNEHHSSLSGRSSRSTSRIGPDRFGDRHGYSGSPNLVASLAAHVASRAGIEPRCRSSARTTKARLHDNEASMPAYQGWRATREGLMACRSTTRSPIVHAWKSWPRTTGPRPRKLGSPAS